MFVQLLFFSPQKKVLEVYQVIQTWLSVEKDEFIRNCWGTEWVLLSVVIAYAHEGVSVLQTHWWVHVGSHN